MWTAAALWAVVVAASVPPAVADQVKTGADNYPRGKVTGFEGGVVKFRTPDLKLHRIPITAVDQMAVDSVAGLKDFNAAESYLFRNQASQAAVRYERALRMATGFWPDLIRVRLLQARDRAGHFDKAVREFIYVAEILPNVAIAMIPESIPDRQGDQTHRTLERIDIAIKRNAGRDPEPVLQMLRYAIIRRVDPEQAAQTAPAIASLRLTAGTERGAEAAWVLQLDAMGLLLKQRRHADVVESVDGALASAPDAVVPELLLLKGQAIYAAAPDGADVEDFIRAGLAFMRVVIHFPKDARAGEALMWTARVHERIDRPSQAVQLLRECLDRGDLSDTTRADARAMLKRMTSDG